MGSPQFGTSATPTFVGGGAQFATPPPVSGGLPPYPTTNGAQFGAPSPSFGVNGTFGPAPVAQPIQDPWQPAPANTGGQLGAPWMKPGETANPFLS